MQHFPRVYITELSLGRYEPVSSWSVSEQQRKAKEREGQYPRPGTKSSDAFTHSFIRAFIHEAASLN